MCIAPDAPVPASSEDQQEAPDHSESSDTPQQQVPEVLLTGSPITQLTDPPTRNLEPGRDFVRAILAIGLLVILAVVVFVGLRLAFHSTPPPAGATTAAAGTPTSESRSTGTAKGESLTPASSASLGPATRSRFGNSTTEAPVQSSAGTQSPTFEAKTTFVLSLLSVVSGLFGAATGFYFGAATRRQQ